MAERTSTRAQTPVPPARRFALTTTALIIIPSTIAVWLLLGEYLRAPYLLPAVAVMIPSLTAFAYRRMAGKAYDWTHSWAARLGVVMIALVALVLGIAAVSILDVYLALMDEPGMTLLSGTFWQQYFEAMASPDGRQLLLSNSLGVLMSFIGGLFILIYLAPREPAPQRPRGDDEVS